MIRRLKRWARRLRRQVLAVYFLARDRRLPLPWRLFALAIAAYALSPIDLIPDAIPVLGYLDDLLIVPLGLALILRFAPGHLVRDARRQARRAPPRSSRAAAIVIVLIWGLATAAMARWLWLRVTR